jgi:WD40 repeat protein
VPQLVREEGFEQRWLDFVYEQSLAVGRSSPPLPLPATIQAACSSPLGAVLYTFDVATGGRSSTEPINPPYAGSTKVWPLAKGTGYVAREEIYRRFELEARLTLHYEGEAHILLRHTLTELYALPEFGLTGQTDPDGRYLVLASDSHSSRYLSRQFLLDLDNCSSADCQAQLLSGRPVWSPDGTHTLIVALPDTQRDNNVYKAWQLGIALGDGAAQTKTAVATGYDPEWLDNTHYGYLRLNEDNIPEWVVASVRDDAPVVQLAAADLMTAVAGLPHPLHMTDITIAAANKVAVLATDDLQRPAMFYLLYGQLDEAPRLLAESASITADFSPDGRWLTLQTADGNVQLYDTDTGQTRPFASPAMKPDWSADSQWLLTGRANYLLLTAPDYEYQQIIYNDIPTCHQINWGPG